MKGCPLSSAVLSCARPEVKRPSYREKFWSTPSKKHKNKDTGQRLLSVFQPKKNAFFMKDLDLWRFQQISRVARHPNLPLEQLVWYPFRRYDGVGLRADITKRSCYRITFSIHEALQDHWFLGFYKRATKGSEPWEHIFWCDRVWIGEYGNNLTQDEALEEAMEICTHHAWDHGLLGSA